jgi:hypothetical protein
MLTKGINSLAPSWFKDHPRQAELWDGAVAVGGTPWTGR